MKTEGLIGVALVGCVAIESADENIESGRAVIAACGVDPTKQSAT